MNHYRDLNKELVEQVQTMRVNMKLYCDEIISLKAELMQKYEAELFIRKYCYNWAIENFYQLIKTVQPDSDVVHLFKEYIKPDTELSEQRSSSTQRSRAPEVSHRISREKISDERRRSTQLAMECRRSNTVINTRTSVRSTSPIRRSNSDNEEVNEQEVEELESEEEELREVENENQLGNRLSEQENEQVEARDLQDNGKKSDGEVRTGYGLASVIYEETDEEVSEEEEEDDLIDQDVDSVEEVSIENLTQRMTLNDITNTKIIQKPNNNSHSTLRKRGRARKDISQEENTTDTETDIEISTERSRRTTNTKRVLDDSVKDIENITLQEVRQHSNNQDCHATKANKSIPTTTHNLSRTCGEVTLASPMSVDMSLRNFKNAASSTPNSRRNTLHKQTTSSQHNAESESDTITTTATNNKTADTSTKRPSRQCKPKVLTEPSLNKKLRNENKTKTKSKTSTKTIRNKKK
ncbi:meiotic from via Salaria 332 [Cochliomyia hominivorax]